MKQMLIFLFFIFALSVQADIIAEVSDTVQQSHLDQTLLLIRQADSLKMADSINQVVLRRQLEELRSFETARRKQLEAELQRLIVNDSLKKVQLKREVDSLKTNTNGYPVVPHRDTLFYVYTNIGSVTAAERTRIVNERLSELYRKFFLKTDSLQIVDYGQTVDVVFQGRIIVSVAEPDALWLEKGKQEIAALYKKKNTVRYKEIQKGTQHTELSERDRTGTIGYYYPACIN